MAESLDTPHTLDLFSAPPPDADPAIAGEVRARLDALCERAAEQGPPDSPVRVALERLRAEAAEGGSTDWGSARRELDSVEALLDRQREAAPARRDALHAEAVAEVLPDEGAAYAGFLEAAGLDLTPALTALRRGASRAQLVEHLREQVLVRLGGSLRSGAAARAARFGLPAPEAPALAAVPLGDDGLRPPVAAEVAMIYGERLQALDIGDRRVTLLRGPDAAPGAVRILDGALWRDLDDHPDGPATRQALETGAEPVPHIGAPAVADTAPGRQVLDSLPAVLAAADEGGEALDDALHGAEPTVRYAMAEQLVIERPDLAERLVATLRRCPAADCEHDVRAVPFAAQAQGMPLLQAVDSTLAAGAPAVLLATSGAVTGLEPLDDGRVRLTTFSAAGVASEEMRANAEAARADVRHLDGTAALLPPGLAGQVLGAARERCELTPERVEDCLERLLPASGPVDLVALAERSLPTLETLPSDAASQGVAGALRALHWADRSERLTAATRLRLSALEPAAAATLLAETVLAVRSADYFGWTEALVARADALPLPEDGQLKDPALGEDGRIEDFGEKIGGARKDLFAFRFRVDTDLPSDWSSLSKASAFPEPPYARLQEAGIPARTLAVVAALRDAIPAKPRHRSSYRRKRWRALLEATREACVAVLDNPGKAESVIATLEASSEMKGVLKRADLLLELGFPEPHTSLKDYELVQDSLTKFDDNGTPREWRGWAVAQHRRNCTWVLSRHDSREEAVQALTERLDGTAGPARGSRPRRVAFDILRDGTDYQIVKRVRRGVYYPLKTGFESARQARDHLTANERALQAQWESVRGGPALRPTGGNAPREGADRRAGRPVTPEMFMETFGFRGVEFGNWVEQARRQRDLDRAYDALTDLAAVIGVPPKALSLNGDLGLAFGARGKGGKNTAAAHYEPGHVVINLTKNAGPGSLAHEWWHAFDHHLGRLDGSSALLTGNDHTRAGQNLRPELWATIQDLKRTIRGSDLLRRSTNADKARSKEYFSTMIEMTARAFERHVRDRLETFGIRNDYLVNFNREMDTDDYPYPRGEEAAVIGAAFQEITDTLALEHTESGVRLYREGLHTHVESLGSSVQDIREALVERFGPRVLDLEDDGLLTVVQHVEDLPADAWLSRATPPRISPDERPGPWEIVGVTKRPVTGSRHYPYHDALTGRGLHQAVWLRHGETGAVHPCSERSAARVLGTSEGDVATRLRGRPVPGPLATAAARSEVAIQNYLRRHGRDSGAPVLWSDGERWLCQRAEDPAPGRSWVSVSLAGHGLSPSGFSDGRCAYLVADQLTPEAAPGVFLHEVAGHVTLPAMLGKHYADLTAEFDRLLAADDPYARLAAALVPDETPAEHVPAERLAHLIEVVENRQTLPELSRTQPALAPLIAHLPRPARGVRGLVARAVSATKAFVYRQPAYRRLRPHLGRLALSLDAQDIGALACQALRRTGEGPVAPSSGARYRLSGELATGTLADRRVEAATLEARGVPPADIHGSTGWYRDGAGHWACDLPGGDGVPAPPVSPAASVLPEMPLLSEAHLDSLARRPSPGLGYSPIGTGINLAAESALAHAPDHEEPAVLHAAARDAMARAKAERDPAGMAIQAATITALARTPAPVLRRTKAALAVPGHAREVLAVNPSLQRLAEAPAPSTAPKSAPEPAPREEPRAAAAGPGL